MPGICTESVLSDGSIQASQSEISFANSSPRLESNASSSTAGISEVLQVRRDVSSDLVCAICNHLFDRPVMVSCGHSFCEGCIERQTRYSQECVICHKDVGNTTNMIPSITLDSIVRKIKAQDLGNSFEDLFICDDRDRSKSAIERSISTRSTRSKRRCFFSIAAPVVCSTPVTVQRRRPLPASAKPSKSALKFPSDSANLSFTDGGSNEKKSIFERNGFGRRSERFTSSTQSRAKNLASYFSSSNNDNSKNSGEKEHGKDNCDIKRNSLLRRSLNAIRSKTMRRRSNIETKAEEADSFIHYEDVSEKNLIGNGASRHKSSQTFGKALWRKLFMSRRKKDENGDTDERRTVMLLKCEKKKENGFFRLENVLELDVETDEDELRVSVSHFSYGYFRGIGKKFERIGCGKEICIVVFGHKQSGKTTFARSVKEMFSKSEETHRRVRTISMEERFQMAGVQNMPFPEGDNRLPHVVSLIVQIDKTTEQVVDIVDPEYDNSCLPNSYMESCDAALLLIDSRNCSSLLSAHQVYRNLKHGNGEGKNIECGLIVNLPPRDVTSRILSYESCENLAKKVMKTSLHEVCIEEMEPKIVEEILLQICKRVIDSRSLQVLEVSRCGIIV